MVCTEGISAFTVTRPLQAQSQITVRFVVPKHLRSDASGNSIDPTEFREFDELIEGLGMYQLAYKPTFLFGTWWNDQRGNLFFRPEEPTKAKHLFVSFRLPEVTPSQDPADDQNEPTPTAPAKRKTERQLLDEYVSKHVVYRPGGQGNSEVCYITTLDYREVEFDPRVDEGYQLEDFYRFQARRLEVLRGQCQQRWLGYFCPTPNTDIPVKPQPADQ